MSGSTVSSQNESTNNDLSQSSIENAAPGGRSKSAISVVQETAQKHELPIRFSVESETGPAHMKHFIITCSVGELSVSKPFECAA